MDEEELESPGLLWTCFINWINTLEKVGDFIASSDQVLNKKREDI